MLLITLILFQLFSQTYDILEERVLEILNRNLPRGTKFSITCFSTQKNDFVIKLNSEIPLIPASTNKLFTTGIALFHLGNNFNINTEIYTDDANLNDGIINGNLYLKGYGDPTLTTADLQNLVLQLKSQKIQFITGNIIVDDTFFEETFFRNEWIEDENISVPLPPISALTINYNTIIIRVTASKKLNSPGYITVEDGNDHLRFKNLTKTTRGKTRITASSEFENDIEIITVRGNIRRNSTISLRVHISQPAIYAGSLLKKLLLENGISFNGIIKKGKVPKYHNRIAYKSTPLIELIKPINKNSNNFYSEHLFLIIGGQYANGNGSPFDASQAIVTTLKSLGIYEHDFNMVDGSGISRQNQFSTELLVKFLYQIYLRPDIFNDFYNSLSIPQNDGTLYYRFSNLYPPDRVRGKTGTLNGVTSLAGFVTTQSGDLIIFAINFNHPSGSRTKLRELQDRILTLIAESL